MTGMSIAAKNGPKANPSFRLKLKYKANKTSADIIINRINDGKSICFSESSSSTSLVDLDTRGLVRIAWANIGKMRVYNTLSFFFGGHACLFFGQRATHGWYGETIFGN